MRCEGTSLLSYKSQLLDVLRLTLHVVCKEVLTLSCLLLRHLLSSLTLVYAKDYRSSTVDWDLPLSQVLPIRVRTGVDLFVGVTKLLLFLFLFLFICTRVIIIIMIMLIVINILIITSHQ